MRPVREGNGTSSLTGKKIQSPVSSDNEGVGLDDTVQ